MILAGVAIVAALGLGAWALLLNDDLNDTEAELRAQTAAAESASTEAQRRIADARANIDAALSDVAGIVVVSDEDVAQAEQAVAEAEQSVAKRRPLTRPKAKSSRRGQNATWPEPRQSKREPKRRKPNCARTPRSQPRRRWPITTTPPRLTRRLRLAPRRPRVPAREMLDERAPHDPKLLARLLRRDGSQARASAFGWLAPVNCVCSSCRAGQGPPWLAGVPLGLEAHLPPRPIDPQGERCGMNGRSSSTPGWTIPTQDSGTSFQAPGRSPSGSETTTLVSSDSLASSSLSG